jgi:hypothetical protein
VGNGFAVPNGQESYNPYTDVQSKGLKLIKELIDTDTYLDSICLGHKFIAGVNEAEADCPFIGRTITRCNRIKVASAMLCKNSKTILNRLLVSSLALFP